jgi:predicted phosphate transport protein (TIGR00153 family)
MRVLPKDEKFFLLFAQQTECIADAAKLLTAAVISGTPLLLGQYVAQVRDIEHKGDEVTHAIMTRLNQTFLTPMDPEDIHRLASCLDDVLDMIDAALGRLMLFKLTVLPPAVNTLAEIIEASSRALVKAVAAMATGDHVGDHLIEINQLENEADRVNRQALADLFDNVKDAIELIKLKEIYEMLESATDLCEDAANVIESVVVKNS